MSKTLLALALSCTYFATAFAQVPNRGVDTVIRESTDPARADQVMQHAQQIRQQQDEMASKSNANAGKSMHSSHHGKKPAAKAAP